VVSGSARKGVEPLLAGVELGGTKCVCILGTGPEDIRAQVRVQTRSSEPTLTEIAGVFASWRTRYGLPEGLGIASFGPLDLRPASRTFGHVVSTVKPGWDGADVLGRLAQGCSIPVEINTDVNGAALAEGRWGAARGLEDFAYVTVGTGIGVGLIVAGQTVFGCNHTELGHVRIARAAGDTWPGNCPYHGDCIEGLASGPAIAARTGAAPSDMSPTHPAWDLVAHALGQLAHNLVLATAPRRILFGGGVVQARPELLVRVREHLVDSLNGYVRTDELTRGISEYIVPPGLGALAGPLGALALAADAAQGSCPLPGTDSTAQ
jgi:fructokinase